MAKGKGTKEKGKKKTPEKKEQKLTKKGIVLAGVRKKGGSMIEELAQRCVDAGLGDLELCKRVCQMWMRKLGVPVKKLENGKFVEDRGEEDGSGPTDR
jgi:hypothetical protein